MLNLIKKDMIVTKYYIKPVLAYFMLTLFFIFFIGKPITFGVIYYINIMVCMFVPLIYTFYYGEKVKEDYIFKSLPVTKREIVLSKYISVLVYIGICTIVTYILFYTTNLFRNVIFNKSISIYFILDLLMIVLFFYSIQIPIYIKFKNRISRFISFFLYFTILQCISDVLKTYLIYQFSLTKFTYFLLLFGSISMFFVSILLSIKIYENKDID